MGSKGASRCVKVVTPRSRAKSMIADMQFDGVRRDSAMEGQTTRDNCFLGSDRLPNPAFAFNHIGITDSTWRRAGGISVLPLPTPPPSPYAVPAMTTSTGLYADEAAFSDIHSMSDDTTSRALHAPAASERDTEIDLEAKIAHLETLIASANEVLEYWTRMKVIAEGDREELMMIVSELRGYLQFHRGSGDDAWANGGNEPQQNAEVGCEAGDEDDAIKDSGYNSDENELAMVMWRCELQDRCWRVAFSEP